jgi:hypothetical protein
VADFIPGEAWTEDHFKALHLAGFNALLSEIYYINESIMTGDCVSAKHALPRVRKLLNEYKATMESEGATEVDFDPYVAAGGWIALRFSYKVAGNPYFGAMTPRRNK